jgi:NOL1/NOP2/sun family putative RNA methylase
VRTGRIDTEALTRRLHDQGFRLRPIDGMPAFLQVEEAPYPVSFTLEHWLGLVYVQQASTGVAAPALNPRRDERILDLCAAPGGKTTHIAELMEGRGALVASEINEGRIRGLLGNVYRLGHPNVLVVSGDGRAFPEEARFHRVLVDAPCSGEGTLRRRGGTPPNQSPSFVRYVTAAQEALLRKAIHVTRPGGIVLYVTCTFAPEENEAVVSKVLQDEPVELEPLDLPVSHAPGLTRFGELRFDARLEGAARVYPHHLDSGGLFLARLRRLGGEEANSEGGAWGPVPSVFPGDPMDPAEAEGLVDRGVSSLIEHFGVDRSIFDGLAWIARGGRLWLHGASAWPLDAWTEGEWRAVSLGFRALGFDTRGRPRPTNDLLQWLDGAATRSRLQVDDAEMERLLAGDPVPRPEEMHGLQAIRYRGSVVGRGVPGTQGLRSEISRARAADLRACLGATRGAAD